MLSEVTERALNHLNMDEVLLAGGVGYNKRLQAMLEAMCKENGVRFGVPGKYCGDNGVMIAWTGLVMHNAGFKQEVKDTAINPNFRTDQVDINWFKEGERKRKDVFRGAEAVLKRDGKNIVKERLKKEYKIQELDEVIRRQRTNREGRILDRVNRVGVRVPRVSGVDAKTFKITMEFIEGDTLDHTFEKESGIEKLSKDIGENIAKLHTADVVHGDLTTSNMMLDDELVIIDFGLAEVSKKVEDKATDLLVLKKALNANHPSIFNTVWVNLIGAYESYSGASAVLERLKKAEKRGRYL